MQWDKSLGGQIGRNNSDWQQFQVGPQFSLKLYLVGPNFTLKSTLVILKSFCKSLRWPQLRWPDPLCQLFKDSCRSLPASQSASQPSTWSQPFSSQCSSPWQRKFSSNSSERKNLMFPPPQIWRQCCEEAKAVLREHIGDDVDPADGLHLLPLLHHLDHLHRQEEEGHRDGFGRGFPWTGTFAKTGRCTCHWRLKGRKVPALLDHHHLHLHLHLLHHHLHRQLSQVHSHRSQPLWLSQSWPDLICCLYLPWQPPLVICFLLLLVFKCFLRSLCLTDINHSSANYLFFEVSYRSSNYFIS